MVTVPYLFKNIIYNVVGLFTESVQFFKYINDYLIINNNTFNNNKIKHFNEQTIFCICIIIITINNNTYCII